MKKAFLFIFAVTLFKFSFPQFKGVLHYERDFSATKQIGKFSSNGGKVFTDISVSGSDGRIDSKKVDYKTGSSTLDNSTTKEQDILLFDFGKQHETTLHPENKIGIITKFMQNQIAQMGYNQMGTVLNIQNLGNEMINNFHCTHYLITQTSSKYKNYPPVKRDVWITKDLGACHIWYVGDYLYWYDGNIFQQKLTEAGASGVVVKWQVQGKIHSSGLLMGYDKVIPAQSFSIPPGYKTMDRTNYSMPEQE